GIRDKLVTGVQTWCSSDLYPFVLNRIERGGLQIMIVLDLSQSMEKPLGKATRMDAVKASTTEFIKRRPGDAIGLAVFSNNAYVEIGRASCRGKSVSGGWRG